MKCMKSKFNATAWRQENVYLPCTQYKSWGFNLQFLIYMGFFLEILLTVLWPAQWRKSGGSRDFQQEHLLQEGPCSVWVFSVSPVPCLCRLSWSPTAAWASAEAPCATPWPLTASAAKATGSRCLSRSHPSSMSCAWPIWKRWCLIMMSLLHWIIVGLLWTNDQVSTKHVLMFLCLRFSWHSGA